MVANSNPQRGQDPQGSPTLGGAWGLRYRQGPEAGSQRGEPELLEAYGPGGAAVLIEVATAKPGVGEAVREQLDRCGCRLGARGALVYLFNTVGLLVFVEDGVERESLESLALGAGAEDVVQGAAGELEVLTAPGDLPAVRGALAAAGLAPALAAVVRRADAVVSLGPDDARQLRDLLDTLAALPGVREVWSNASAGTPGAAQ